MAEKVEKLSPMLTKLYKDKSKKTLERKGSDKRRFQKLRAAIKKKK